MSALEYVSLQDKTTSEISEANVLCLGNFDGVHVAHRSLIQAARNLRDTQLPHASCGVFCFRTPSSDFLFADPPRHLCSLEQKLERFAEEGMEFAVLADFQALQALSPHDFVEEVLKRDCGCVGAVCGYNYSFGQFGAGTPQMLSTLLQAPVIVQSEICDGGIPISSTRIRTLIAEGQVRDANRLLGLPYSITAPVVHGKQLGRRLLAPTVNQFFPNKMQVPKNGVYFTQVQIDGTVYRGITNVGVHPTVDREARLNFETHLLDFKGDLYGRQLTVHFLDFIRPEYQFDSVEALQKQIQADIRAARARIK